MRHSLNDFCRYLPINETLFFSPIYLTSAGRAVIPPKTSYPPSGHPDLYQFTWQEGRVLPEFSLHWIEKGRGIWQTRKGSFPIHAGQVGQVFSGEWHRYRPDTNTGWTECWLQFNGRLAHEFKSTNILDPTHPVKTPRNAKQFAFQFLHFLHDIASPKFVNSLGQGLRIAGLLGLLDDSPIPTITGLSLVEKALQHILNHSHHQLNVSAVARALGVSRRTLERAFIAKGKSGVLEEINLCRVNRAEHLLRETHLSVQHIVDLAGFGTAEQMRLHFHARHGLSPSEYRAKKFRT